MRHVGESVSHIFRLHRSDCLRACCAKRIKESVASRPRLSQKRNRCGLCPKPPDFRSVDDSALNPSLRKSKRA